ncbi:rhomboid family intramembrane serine protease [Natronolimnobius sp. AArcel1]|uniref:rhomboid family intramembrane serine protease n=1 Tax=Natronolimnobius sp. AArcel1 TaxID=1679093 RepID=UPI0013ED80CD|nr:rhomboid family intramembrane serine protease [Natronolimnobius sp. AArcel1]NGM70883.1 rhomboid family intramembrane serine protease [Natronolimnobius sp. AArcel1]
MSPIAALLAAVIVATVVLSLAVVRRLADPDRRWRDIAGDRLIMGVPWGSLIVIAFVLAVYLFVQNGITDPSDPVTIPYRSWSYFYPLGILTASFSHASAGHLVSNLAGTVVAAPIAEYAWSHYAQTQPRETRPDDGMRARLRTWWTTPWIRAVVLFPLAVIAIGLLTSIFSLGPVIGFSGVVFAFVGFAIVHYPIMTLIGVIGVQSALQTLYRALQNPIYTYTAEPSPPTAPSWAEIAIQGHALGFFFGLVLALVVLERRGNRPNALHVWLAILLYAISRGLWQIYWFGENQTYILFQGPGLVIVAVLALLITVALTATERPVLPARIDRALASFRDRNADEHPGAVTDRVLEIATGNQTDTTSIDRIRDIARATHARERTRLSRITQRSSAVLVVLLVLAVLSGMAIPVNLNVVVFDDEPGDEAIEIEDYTIEYAEEAENQLVSGIGLDELVDDSGLEATGVIVSSEQRNIWMEAIPDQQLAHTGEETVSVGGPGWRETVSVDRHGWEPVGNDPVYQVRMWEADSEPTVVHESDEKTADLRIDNRLITIVPDDGEFVLEVESSSDVETAPLPEPDEPTAANGLEFEYEDETIYAVSDGTAVAIASEETYN